MNIEYLRFNKVIASPHPFILFSNNPPNEGNPITDITQLLPRGVKPQNMLSMKAVPPSKYRFHIDLSEDEYPVTNEWTLAQIATEYPPFGWEPLFMQSEADLAHLDKHLQVWDYYPQKKWIFRAFEECPFNKLKVVLIGQDPYPGVDRKTGEPNAMGLSFSTQRDHNIPVSLQAIFKEIKNSIGDVGPFNHPDLTKWANQGVLLLNTTLTVEKGKPKSHKKEWTGFVPRALKYIQTHKKNCIYILLGGDAKNLIGGRDSAITDGPRVITAGHPSTMNRNRNKDFFGSGIFIRVNELLLKDGETPIDWNID